MLAHESGDVSRQPLTTQPSRNGQLGYVNITPTRSQLRVPAGHLQTTLHGSKEARQRATRQVMRLDELV